MDSSPDNRDARHRPSGRWRLGLLLTLATLLLWSTVPVALRLLLDRMDAVTITWYRFLFAATVLALFLRWRGTLPRLARLRTRGLLGLVAVAAIGLTGSFVVYLSSLNFIPPGGSAVVYQLATYFVLFGGVVLFRESFGRAQSCGLVVLTLGLVLFLNQRLTTLFEFSVDYSFGVLLVVIASVVWASYALAQKQLLTVSSSPQIMFLLYGLGVLMMLPLTSLGQIRELSALQSVVLAYSCLNTLVAYGCFAESLQHWEASRVSAVLATVPLLTLLMSIAGRAVWPERIMSEELDLPAVFGAVLVVVGSAMAALGGRAQDRKNHE